MCAAHNAFVEMLDSKMLFCIKVSIMKTLDAKREDGSFLMTKRRSWIAIHRVLAELGYTDPGDLMAFERLVNNLFIDEPLRIPVNGKDLQKLSSTNDIFNRNFLEWRHHHGTYTSKVFSEYRSVAFKFYCIFNLEHNRLCG
jgi:hypothetical protein